MNSHEFDTQAELQEETQAARGRTLELLLNVVLISALLGLAINLDPLYWCRSSPIYRSFS